MSEQKGSEQIKIAADKGKEIMKNAMNEAICHVVGAGEIGEVKLFSPDKGDYVIGVDGGYEYLEKMQIEADLVVGDFDSLCHEPEHKNTIRLPAEKDDTDMFFALKQGVKQGYKQFCIYGGLGGRVSHTIANLQCLLWLARQGMRGWLVGKDVLITVIKNESIQLEKERKGYLSVFAFDGTAKGVYLKNLKYPLQDAVLTTDFPIGTSNEFIGEESEITVEDGALIVVLEECKAGES